MNTTWQPNWWQPQHDSSWERIKEALRRDWEQTKHDFHLKGGHELNQSIKDTVQQATNNQPLPPHDKPNPPKVIGSWDDIEGPVRYGYGAREHYGERYPHWTDQLEQELSTEWAKGKQELRMAWADIKDWVRHGYDAKDKDSKMH